MPPLVATTTASRAPAQLASAFAISRSLWPISVWSMAVHVGRIDERDAGVEGGVQGADRVGFRGAGRGDGQVHSAVADGGDLHGSPAQGAQLHQPSPSCGDEPLVLRAVDLARLDHRVDGVLDLLPRPPDAAVPQLADHAGEAVLVLVPVELAVATHGGEMGQLLRHARRRNRLEVARRIGHAWNSYVSEMRSGCDNDALCRRARQQAEGRFTFRRPARASRRRRGPATGPPHPSPRRGHSAPASRPRAPAPGEGLG